ncbi:MAG: VOC family protein [Gaiellaceae bacterium]
MEFDHIGIPAPAKRERMRYLEPRRLWLTSPADHPFRVEWLWYEPDSPEHELVRSVSHVAYRVRSLEDAMEGHPVIAEPFDVFGEVRVSFIEVDGAPVEFVQPYE